MSDTFPEFYIAEGVHTADPAWELLAACQLIVAADNGQVGPALREEGFRFISFAPPNHFWRPLNRAAAHAYESWLGSLPLDGKSIPQEYISQAAFEFRPREGDPEFPHDLWWGKVMARAAQLVEQRKGRSPTVVRPASGLERGSAQQPVMPFASTTGTMPLDVGRAPANAPPVAVPAHAARGVRRAQPQPAMANTAPGDSPSQTAG